jgi:chemotaxis response regulator CheB
VNGVSALKTLIGALPAELPATIVVVLHSPAHTETQLHRILARAATLPVLPAVDGEPSLPGHVYVARPTATYCWSALAYVLPVLWTTDPGTRPPVGSSQLGA